MGLDSRSDPMISARLGKGGGKMHMYILTICEVARMASHNQYREEGTGSVRH